MRCDYSTRLLFGLGQVRSGSGKDVWGGSYDSGSRSVGKEQWGLLGASSSGAGGKQNEKGSRPAEQHTERSKQQRLCPSKQQAANLRPTCPQNTFSVTNRTHQYSDRVWLPVTIDVQLRRAILVDGSQTHPVHLKEKRVKTGVNDRGATWRGSAAES